MDQKGRLVVREYGARLEEAVHRIRYERDSLMKLLQNAYDELDSLREIEQTKQDNIEYSGNGLEHTNKAGSIRDGVVELEDALSDIENLQIYLEVAENHSDPLDVEFRTLLKISKG